MLKASAAALSALCLTFAPLVSRAAEPTYVIEDNDFLGPGGSNIQSALPLIAAKNIKLLGFTVVTGDGWRDEETYALLKLLEAANISDIPVYKGAERPLINTPAQMRVWEQAYGKIPWKGAWNAPTAALPDFHPDEPHKIPASLGAPPKLKAASGSAVQFLIDQVHQHPHQVVIVASGPMTNLALAIRQDPEFASLAKELILQGGYIDNNLAQVDINANFFTDFNFMFDPEAAHITLTADWPKITVIAGVSNGTILTDALNAQIAAKNTPIARYVAQYADKGLPLWDELVSAIAVDPSLITRSVEVAMDVDTLPGYNYGRAHIWPDSTAPHHGERKVIYVEAIDSKRFVEQMLKAAEYR